jgi:MFS family permease
MSGPALTQVPGTDGLACIGRHRQSTLGNIVQLSAATLGNLANESSLLLYSIGVFISRLQLDFGWSRADIALSVTVFTLVIFLGTPLIGRIGDRFDPGRLAAVSLFFLGACLMIFPHYIHTVAGLWVFYFGLAVVGLGTSPVIVNRPIASRFSRGRGLAIGFVITGQGLGAFVAPRLASAVMAKGSWIAGYSALGAVAVAIAPILWFGLGTRRHSTPMMGGEAGLNSPGVSFQIAFRLPVFWLLSTISVLAGLGMSGAVAHLVPFLHDQNMSMLDAAKLASLLGLSNVAGRIMTGFTLDRTEGPGAGLPFLGIGAIGLAILIAYGAPAATIAVLMLGFTVGSEFDLVAYFTSRYFGLRAYSAIFGWHYGMVAFGAAIAPLLLGILRDHLGNYSLGFAFSSACLGIAAVLCPFLGRYRYAP